jgi:Plant transposon protein
MSVDSSNIESTIDDDTILLDNNKINGSIDDKSMDISDSIESSFSSKDEKVMEVLMQSTEALCHAASLFAEETLFEEEPNSAKIGGLQPRKAPHKDRDFAMAFDRLIQDYFSGENSIYDEVDFERRCGVSRTVFKTIYYAILYKGMFSHKKDATGKLGIHPLVRTVACFRYLAYIISFDSCDESLRLSATCCLDSVKEFCSLVVQNFGIFDLNRTPLKEERNRILNYNKSRGFPRMLASRGCSHFKWDKCPRNMKTVVLECVVDCNLWIWFMNLAARVVSTT